MGAINFENIKAILFDLDGTLVETAPDLADTVNHILREHTALAPLPESQLRTYIGGGLTLMFERTLTHYGQGMAILPMLVELGMRAYPQFNGRRSYLFEGMEEALHHLAQSNIACAVVTNKWERFTHPLLEKLSIAHHMRVVVGGDTLPTKKPDPAPLLYACEKIGVPIAQTLMIGDSAFDVHAAKNAGCASVCVDYGYTETPPEQLDADLLIHSVHDFVREHFPR